MDHIYILQVEKNKSKIREYALISQVQSTNTIIEADNFMHDALVSQVKTNPFIDKHYNRSR